MGVIVEEPKVTGPIISKIILVRLICIVIIKDSFF
jgi:hypothetical protein